MRHTAYLSNQREKNLRRNLVASAKRFADILSDQGLRDDQFANHINQAIQRVFVRPRTNDLFVVERAGERGSLFTAPTVCAFAVEVTCSSLRDAIFGAAGSLDSLSVSAQAFLMKLSAGGSEEFSKRIVFFENSSFRAVQNDQIHAPIQCAAFGRGIRCDGSLACIARQRKSRRRKPARDKLC